MPRVDPIAGNLLGAPPASGGGSGGAWLAGGCVATAGVGGFGALARGLGGPSFTSFEPVNFVIGEIARSVISSEIIANNVGDWTILADARIESTSEEHPVHLARGRPCGRWANRRDSRRVRRSPRTCCSTGACMKQRAEDHPFSLSCESVQNLHSAVPAP